MKQVREMDDRLPTEDQEGVEEERRVRGGVVSMQGWERYG
jgi:hypothetical protein